MSKTTATHEADHPTRRTALRRLAGAALAAYVVPEVLFLSAARADDDGPSVPDVSTPSPSPPAPSPSSAPDDSNDPVDTGKPDDTGDTADTSGTGESDDGTDTAAVRARDTCNLPRAGGNNTISISRSDLARAQEAVAAGDAKPLGEIWGTFKSGYDGEVIGVEFLGQRRNTRYRFRAISKTGRLETVTISAQTGVIQRIVGC